MGKEIRKLLSGGLVLIVLLALLYYTLEHVRSTGPASVASISVSAPDIVVTGTNLSSVEVWAVPTGTGVSEADYELLGKALLDTTATDRWVFPIPAQPVLATQIFAKGYDANGTAVGTVTLPYTGATELADALWPGASASSTPVQGATTFTLKPGEKAQLADLSFTITGVTEDSRCAQGLQCVWAGRVAAAIDATNGATHATGTVATDAPFTIGRWTIALTDVAPAKTQADIAPGDYRFTVSATRSDTGSTDTSATGVNGKVVLGPTCPVERIPPDPQCAPKPFQTTFVITDASGRAVRTISSDAEGLFQVALPAGQYTFAPQSQQTLPRCSSQSVTVVAGAMASVTIDCDTGIR